MRLLIIILSMFCFSSAFADNIPVYCPSTLTCNYTTGTCNVPATNGPNQWSLDSGTANESFAGDLTIALSGIKAYKVSSSVNSVYQINCDYAYGQDSKLSIYTYLNDLIGTNWIYSGFGNQQAICSIIPNSQDTSYCAGEMLSSPV